MVHQYQLNGYNIVLDTCSGAIHVVDEVAYDIIALYPDHTADEIVTAMMEKYGEREDVTEQDTQYLLSSISGIIMEEYNYGWEMKDDSITPGSARREMQVAGYRLDARPAAPAACTVTQVHIDCPRPVRQIRIGIDGAEETHLSP